MSLPPEIRHESGKVLEILSGTEVVFDLGARDEVREGSWWLVYAVGDEVRDLETSESLGRLELVRGLAEATRVQENTTTLRSIDPKKVTGDVEISAPFKDVKIGDLVRLL